MTWTIKEIRKLNELQELENDLAGLPVDVFDEFEDQVARMLQLEAELLIQNKDVYGIVENKIVGIYRFNEVHEKEMRYIRKGKIFYYLPINIKSFEELHSYAY